MTEKKIEAPMIILPHETSPHGLKLGSSLRGITRGEGDLRWRAHIIFNRWHVWEFVFAPTFNAAMEILHERMKAKGRGMIPVASLVNAEIDSPGYVSMNDQQEVDRDQPDGTDAFRELMTDEERTAMETARRENDQRTADAIMVRLAKEGDERAIVARARAKRDLCRKRMHPGGLETHTGKVDTRELDPKFWHPSSTSPSPKTEHPLPIHTNHSTKMAASKSIAMFSPEIEEVLSQVRSKYGADAIISGANLGQSHLRRFALDVFALDQAIGGGIPRGRVSMFTGEYSSGKTTLAIRAAASAQKKCRYCDTLMKYTVNAGKKKEAVTLKVSKSCECGKNKPGVVVYVDIENTFDRNYAKLLGFDADLGLIVQPEYAEKGINIVVAMVESGEADLIVVDSIAALTPTVEAEEGSEKWQQGLAARLVNKFMRALISALSSLGSKNSQKPAILLINQKRLKIGVMYGNPETTPGGKGQEFTTSLIVDLIGSSAIRLNDKGEETKEKGEPVGRVVLWKVKKNKITGRMGMGGDFKLYNTTLPKWGITPGMVNNEEQILGYAKLYGLIEVRHGGRYAYDGITTQGVRNFLLALREQKKWFKLKKEVTRVHTTVATITEE